jgi:predicted RNA-binding Zn ribbon-like protein
MDHDESVLLALLNSRPVIDDTPQDALADEEDGAQWLRDRGGSGSKGELRAVRQARDLLTAVVRGEAPAAVLSDVLAGAHQVPELSDQGLTWRLNVAEDSRLAVTAVLEWADLARTAPGRLRPCANAECRLFLIDRSRANSARWCSMAVCGNRLKARRHHERMRATSS